MKTPAYPNKYFTSVDEYTEFAIKHHVFGSEALKLRQSMSIPEPKIKKGKKCN